MKAQSQRYIIINADGTINPSSAPIVQNGNTYTLISNINGYIIITKSNITFNGNGHTINQQTTNRDSSNAFGVELSHVYNVTVANATIINTGNGIYAIQNPTAGIYVDYGGSNTIIRNNVVNNYNAISLLETNNNLIIENNITNNNNPYVIVRAVTLWGSSYNKVYYNNFVDNTSPAGTGSFNSPSTGNQWDNAKVGNFWDDYNGTDANGDGIGDTPYRITAYRDNLQNADDYPLMAPFNSTLYSLKTTSPAITLLSPIEQRFNESNVPLTFLVDKAVNWTGYVLDGVDNVTVAGNATLTGLTDRLHNVTVYAQDTYGNIGTSQTTNFTLILPIEEKHQAFPTVPVVAISIVVVAIATASLLVNFNKRKHSLVKSP
jgi:parallel beta-helix repeat protein